MLQYHSGAVAMQCYRRIDFPMGVLACFSFYFSQPYSVKTLLLTHAPNDLFHCKGVRFGSLVQKFSTPTPQAPKI